MPKFFLHLIDRGMRVEDPDGRDLLGSLAARAEAIRTAREMMAEDIRAGRLLHPRQIEICNEAGEVLEVVKFLDVLRALDK